VNNALRIVIIGAGPAGLTAALELQASGMKNITVLEADSVVGGISRTVNYKGNRIDIGGHRFFSKSDWVMQWWASLLPVEKSLNGQNLSPTFQYQGKTRHGFPSGMADAPLDEENVMLTRNRLSRIYFNNQFFDYPLKLNLDTFIKLGFKKTTVFGFSYLKAQLKPIAPENSLEDFLVNRFGQKLYRQFFKEYTEKVWGVPCSEISAAWGAQRIKSLSVATALWHALRNLLGMGQGKAAQTSLIESFLYPKYGPGQMWETAADRFRQQGGTLLMDHKVSHIKIEGGKVESLTATTPAGESLSLDAECMISTMPIKELVAASRSAWPDKIQAIAANLQYRDFITVGLLYPLASLPRTLDDNWIYIQEPGVQVGRVQVFNNWSPHMVVTPGHVWLGLEFFCREGEGIWQLSDAELSALGQREMKQIGLVASTQANDSVVIRVPKAYPGYFGTAYEHFAELQKAIDQVDNLFLIGRNGMHRYNNQDHSMLTAKKAVELIVTGNTCKDAIWAVNVDDDYHEQK
jgi:protoporphyrinogen oxidase